MIKKSLQKTLLINIAAFVLVLMLELLSGWINKDKFDSSYIYFDWALSYAVYIMGIIWINHFVLIPFILDKKRYFLFGILLLGTLLIGACLKGDSIRWSGISKFFFFFMYTTGTGMAAYFLRRNTIIQ